MSASGAGVRRWWFRHTSTVLLGSMLAVIAMAVPASAHEGEKATAAIDDVRQAIAVIVNKPDDMDTITDKIGDALESEDQHGVNMALVKQAKDTLDSNDMMKVRDLLQRAIGARPDLTGTDVRPILQVAKGQSTVPLATGEETGTTVVTDELPGRSGLTGGDVTLLVLAGLVALAGLVFSVRSRPADTIRALRRRAATMTRR
jgi:osmotically-inducible protein OsmY